MNLRASRWLISHKLLVPMLLAVMAILALQPLVEDSITFDEPSKLVAGYSALVTGDYRLAPEHPPLARVWAALPLLLLDLNWIAADHPGWINPSSYWVGREWLFTLNNGYSVVTVARLAMLVLLLFLGLAIYASARSAFGPNAGLLALMLATFSPTLQAHGHLVATDVALALACTLTLLGGASLARCISRGRVLVMAAALSSAALIKFSWPLLLPALAAMALYVLLRREPVILATRRARHALHGFRSRLLALCGVMALVGLIMLVAIWSAYGWRSDPISPAPDGVGTSSITAAHMETKWRQALFDAEHPKPGALPTVIRWLDDSGLLPRTYTLGLATTFATTRSRNSFLLGEHTAEPRPAYFPIALLVKTPIPTLLLIGLGATAVATRRIPIRNGALLIGIGIFALTYLGVAITGGINIGIRHVLPVYAMLFVLAGAAVAFASGRWRQWLIAALLVWLAGTSVAARPHYLCYFNAIAGGAKHGHEILSDSNIDWGQDLIRLKRYADRHPNERLHLAYFGSALPRAYGIRHVALPSYLELPGRPVLGAGTYVISTTLLQGTYHVAYRAEHWCKAETVERYRALHVQAEPSSEQVSWRFARLVSRLRERPADARIGCSLWLYRLDEERLSQLLQPDEGAACLP